MSPIRLMIVSIVILIPMVGIGASISFQNPVSILVGSSPRGLIVGHFTDNSQACLAVANFGSPTFIGQSTSQSVLVNQKSTVQVFMPNPSGLALISEIPVGWSPRSLAAVPDGFGKEDLLVSCYDSKLLQLFHWNGSQFKKLDETSTLNQPVGVCYGITRAGGIPFVAVADYGNNQISVYEIKNGKFGTRYDFAVPVGPTQVAVGDLHGDGFNEIVAACLGTGQLVVLSPSSSTPNDLSAYSISQYLIPAPGSDLSDLRITDLNRDGKADIAAIDFTKNILWVYLQQKDGSLALQAPLATNGNHPNGLTVADLDNTGVPVIVVANRDSDLLDLYQWTGNLFQPLQSLKVAFDPDSSYGPVEVAALDTRGTGKLDLVTTHMRSNSIKILPQALGTSLSPTPTVLSAENNQFSERTTFCFPNPSHDGHLTFSFNLSNPQNVGMKIFDISGTLVFSETFGSDQTKTGNNQFSWNGVNQGGVRLASGLYIYSITTGSQTVMKKLAIIY